MLKNFISGVITVLFLIIINIILNDLTDTHFIDVMLFVGIVISLIIMFFSSSGGFTTKYTDLAMGNPANDKGDKNFKFSPNVPFIVSVTYALAGLLAILFIYVDYFS
ncbi:hypothetical protein [Virgibacillus halodenitrificans]|uniref:hypothetical protein n=1 Tax=Virgibacillus halodenitrificans TaxID=1482 RepID=UPI000EF4CE0D|nr:hypothetical protein [Virgibacillus halodenitrificans]